MNFPSAFPSDGHARGGEHHQQHEADDQQLSEPEARHGAGPEHRLRGRRGASGLTSPALGRTLADAVRILGHRGASSDAPENTLAAFQLALDQGADGVELDARLCGSGEVVVFHDAAAGAAHRRHRPGGGHALVGARAAGGARRSAGRRPRANPAAVRGAGGAPAHGVHQRRAARARTWTGTRGGRRRRRAARGRAARGPRRRLVVRSALPLAARARPPPAPARAPARSGPAAARPAHLALPLLGRDAVHPEAGQLSEADVRRWHAGGREVAVWTVDDPEVARRLRAWGVDSCITNRPGALRAALAAVSGLLDRWTGPRPGSGPGPAATAAGRRRMMSTLREAKSCVCRATTITVFAPSFSGKSVRELQLGGLVLRAVRGAEEHLLVVDQHVHVEQALGLGDGPREGEAIRGSDHAALASGLLEERSAAARGRAPRSARVRRPWRVAVVSCASAARRKPKRPLSSLHLGQPVHPGEHRQHAGLLHPRHHRGAVVGAGEQPGAGRRAGPCPSAPRRCTACRRAGG